MEIDSKKNFAIFYKNLSTIYGHIDIKNYVKNTGHRIFDFRFFGKSKFYNNLQINSNYKKIIEYKENSIRDLQELALVSDNLVFLKLLKRWTCRFIYTPPRRQKT